MEERAPREHYNLYYLFLEDKRSHPLPPARAEEIRKRILELYRGS